MLLVPSLVALAVTKGPHIVICLTSNSKYQAGSPRALAGKTTGWYLPEAAHPYYVFTKYHYEVSFASPLGGHAPVDPGSIPKCKIEDPTKLELGQKKEEEYCNKADEASLKFWQDEKLRALTENTKRLEDIDREKIGGIFFAGGFGAMWDFPQWEYAQDLVRFLFARRKPIGAVRA